MPESAADLPAHDKGHSAVRFMSIPPFGRPIEIPDFDFFVRSRFVRSRLNQAIVVWPEQAIALVGYMAWPNDPEAREASKSVCGLGLRDRWSFRPGCARFKATGCGSPTSSTYTTT